MDFTKFRLLLIESKNVYMRTNFFCKKKNKGIETYTFL